MEYTFISYSRKQLYFAEAIALHLQKAGIEIWFDLQQLGAGTDWAASLKEGYENCQRLILVVSQAALASKYVEEEWDTALQNGREVILAVVESVNIPEKLRDCVVIDFRTNFKAAIKRLLSHLNGNRSATKVNISPSGKFPYHLRLPLPIWFTIIASMWPYIWMIVVTIMSGIEIPVQQKIIVTLVSVGLGVLAFTFGVRQFWKHNLDYRGVRNLGAFAIIVQIILIPFSAESPLIWPILISLILNVYFYFWFANRSATLLRWFAAGQAPQKLRRQCHAGLLGKDAQLGEIEFKSEPVEFFLHNDPADKPLAKYISKILVESGHCEVDITKDVQRNLYLITNRTSIKMIEEASKNSNDTNIFLLGSSIDWSEGLENAGKSQFVDLRELDANDIKVFAATLSDMELWRRHYALEATPVKFEAFTAPSSVQFYRFLAYGQASLFLINGLLLLINRGFQLGSVFLILMGLGIFFLVEYALQRKVPFLIVLGVLAGLPLLISLISQNYAGAIGELLVMGVILYKARFWFPSFAPLAKDAIGMDRDKNIRAWGAVFIVIITIVNLAIFYLN